ncbi:MAG: rRNA maturation RNase YbeY [Acidiferrobacteraceae bacterium]
MGCHIAVQYAADVSLAPKRSLFRKWALAAVSVLESVEYCELTIRVVGAAESGAHNERFRRKQGATNVLSFSYDDHKDPSRLLGDIVICAPVVQCEARDQGKTESAHWAHMVVHAIMHLCGHDHETPDQAAVMEALETCALRRIGFGNPYE